MEIKSECSSLIGGDPAAAAAAGDSAAECRDDDVGLVMKGPKDHSSCSAIAASPEKNRATRNKLSRAPAISEKLDEASVCVSKRRAGLAENLMLLSDGSGGNRKANEEAGSLDLRKDCHRFDAANIPRRWILA